MQSLGVGSRILGTVFQWLVCLLHNAELLNESLFFGIGHARGAIAAWVADYNTARPHSSLGYATPADFASMITATHTE